MKKKLLCSFIVFSLLMLAGCDRKISDADTSSDTYTNELSSSLGETASSYDTSYAPDSEATSGNITGVSSGMNVFINTENGQIASGLAEKQDLSKGLSLTVYTSFMPESSLHFSQAEADIYVFCNGQVIKHSEDKESIPSEKTRHTISLATMNSIPIYIPPTSIGDYEDALLWICINYMPDYVAQDGMGEVQMTSLWYVPVISHGKGDTPSLYEADEENYLIGIRPTTSGGENINAPYIDIGTYSEKYHSTSKNTMDDLSRIDSDTDFALTAYLESDADYYFAVFRNGELLDAFDGKTFMNGSFCGGKRMIKYSFDKTLLPRDGVYSYNVIAMPTEAEISDDGSDFAVSYRRRITIAVNENPS